MSDAISLALKLNIYGARLGTPWEFFSALAREAEDQGYDGVYVVDHLYLPTERYSAYTWTDPTRPYFLDAWSVLAALGAVTRRIRIGPQVSPLTFRHPALLAKAAATVDLISNGRLTLQLGTGWHREEHTTYGLEFPEAISDRVGRLREGVAILRGLFETDGPYSFDGEHFTIDSAPFWPKPVQRPGPPIWFGGSTRASQRLVGQIGDGWSPAMPQGGGMGVAEYATALEFIRRTAAEKERDPDAITAGLLVTTAIHETREGAAEIAEVLRRRGDYAGISLEELASRGAIVWGTPDDCRAAIQAYLDVGVRHVTLNFVPFGDGGAARRGMELYASRVAPRLELG